jgi:hypothetical protein
MRNVLDPSFYADLPTNVADEARAAAVRVRGHLTRMVRDAIAVGLELLAVKTSIGHGRFLDWIDVECGISADSAERLMRVATTLAERLPQSADFGLTAAYALAYAPEEVREVLLKRAAAGERLTERAVKEACAASEEIPADPDGEQPDGAPSNLEDAQTDATPPRPPLFSSALPGGHLSRLSDASPAQPARAVSVHFSTEVLRIRSVSYNPQPGPVPVTHTFRYDPEERLQRAVEDVVTRLQTMAAVFEGKRDGVTIERVAEALLARADGPRDEADKARAAVAFVLDMARQLRLVRQADDAELAQP